MKNRMITAREAIERLERERIKDFDDIANLIRRQQQQIESDTKLRSDLLADDRNQDPPGMEQKL